ncbi:MAG: FixH family protein [Phycisphaerales bacterium JB065]
MAIKFLIPVPIIACAIALASCDQPTPTDSLDTADPITTINTATEAHDAATDEYCGDPALDTQTRTATTPSGDYTVELIGLPPSVTSNEIFSFQVTLSAAPDIPTDNLSIIVDAGMPQHAHGMTVRPQATPAAADGLFRVDGMLFHMPGAWDLTIDVVDGPYTERVTFHVEAR